MARRIFITASFFLLAFAVLPHAVFADDPAPQAYWKLDETSGTTVHDSAGGSDGAVYGNANWVAGEFNNAFSFDGSTYIGTNYTYPAQDSSTSFTWAAWLYANDNNPTNVVVLGWRTGSTWIKLTASGLEYGGGMVASHSIATDRWVHVVIVKDGTNFSYYEAGQLVSSGTSDSSVDPHEFYLGSDPDSPGDGFFSGKLDDVRLYDTALTADQVEAVYDDAEVGLSNVSSSTSKTAATVTWDTGEAADSTVWYGTSSGDYTMSTTSASLVTSHSLGISGLSFPATYYFVVASKDSSGNTATSSESTFMTIDTVPPVISAIATSTTDTGATVTWTTDKDASTKISYSPDTSFASTTSETDTGTRVTSHSESISGLAACSLYNFEVASANASGVYATSTSSTFTTTGCPGNATPSAATTTSVTVNTAATSTLADGNNSFTVATPANFTATSSSVVIQIKGLDSSTALGSIGTPSSDLKSAASIVFDVTALINGSIVLDSFDAPVTITYAFTDADVSGLDKSSLKMYHYHDGAWLALDDCSVDTVGDTITCDAPSFSTFAIFGTPTSTASSGSSSNSSMSGNSIQSQVATLIAMGKSAVAATIEAQWPSLFPALATPVEASTAPALAPAVESTAPMPVRDLKLGMTGADVKVLQQFLNAHNSVIAATSAGSPGNETTYFGALTKKALAAYQKATDISPAAGYFGPITRAYIAGH